MLVIILNRGGGQHYDLKILEVVNYKLKEIPEGTLHSHV